MALPWFVVFNSVILKDHCMIVLLGMVPFPQMCACTIAPCSAWINLIRQASQTQLFKGPPLSIIHPFENDG
jgi:hypothetical protein